MIEDPKEVFRSLALNEAKELLYHGTSLVAAKRILSQGFVPDPKKKFWGKVKGELASFPGTYLTAEFATALSAAEEAGRSDKTSPVIFIVQVETRTAKFDEDELPSHKAVIQKNMTQYVVKRYAESPKSYQDLVQERAGMWLDNLGIRLRRGGVPLSDEAREALQPYVRALIDQSFQEWLEDEDFIISQGESDEMRKAREDLYNKVGSVASARPGGVGEFGAKNARVPSPIGFRGANKIVGAVELQNTEKGSMIAWNGETRGWESSVTPPVAKVLYGYMPKEMLQSWKLFQAGATHADIANVRVVGEVR